MTKSAGINITAAYKKTLLWGTALACGVNNGILMKPLGITKTKPDNDDDSLGLYFSQDSDPGEITCEGDISSYMRYDGLDVLIAQVMGGSSSPSYTGAASSDLLTGTATGTSDAGSTTTTLEDLSQNWTVNDLQGRYIYCGAGTGIYQTRKIVSNTADTITVALWTDPSNDTTYTIYEFCPIVFRIATSGGASTLIDNTQNWGVNAHSINDRFVKITAGTSSGDCRKITSNTSDTLTVDSPWTATPDNTSVYEISGGLAQHVYTAERNNNGEFGVLPVDHDSILVNEFTSVKPMGLSISGEYGKPAELVINTICNNRISDSAVNTTGTMDNVTFRETANRLLFKGANCDFRLNNQSAGALTTGAGNDSIDANSFEYVFNRAQRGVYLLTGTEDVIDEPVNDNKPETVLTLGFDKYENTTHDVNWDANTAQKADITFTGNTVAAVDTADLERFSNSQARTFFIEFPNLKYIDVQEPMEIGIIPQDLTFKAHGASSAPTGMSGLTTVPLRITMTNTYGGDPLQLGNE